MCEGRFGRGCADSWVPGALAGSPRPSCTGLGPQRGGLWPVSFLPLSAGSQSHVSQGAHWGRLAPLPVPCVGLVGRCRSRAASSLDRWVLLAGLWCPRGPPREEGRPGSLVSHAGMTSSPWAPRAQPLCEETSRAGRCPMPPLCPVGAPALGVDGGLTQTWPACWALAGRTPQGCCARAPGSGLTWGPGGRARPSWLELRAGPHCGQRGAGTDGGRPCFWAARRAPLALQGQAGGGPQVWGVLSMVMEAPWGPHPETLLRSSSLRSVRTGSAPGQSCFLHEALGAARWARLGAALALPQAPSRPG